MPQWKLRNTGRARKLRREATPAERKLWAYLCKNQLGAKFSRQMPVGPYFADFLCRELNLVVELDGQSHDRTPVRDARRDHWMRDQGYVVMRFPNADVSQNAEGVVAAIRAQVTSLQRGSQAVCGKVGPSLPSRLREGPGVRNCKV